VTINQSSDELFSGDETKTIQVIPNRQHRYGGQHWITKYPQRHVGSRI